jgi:hypothetical protein
MVGPLIALKPHFHQLKFLISFRVCSYHARPGRQLSVPHRHLSLSYRHI